MLLLPIRSCLQCSRRLATLAVIAIVVHRSRYQLAWILVGIALSFVIGTEASVLRSKLTIDRRYREVNIISIAGAVAGQSTVCVLALLGWGALSFAILPVAQAATETILTRKFAGAISVPCQCGNLSDYRSLFRDARWVMLGAGALGLATSGDYLAVGMIASLATTGSYFFAFQLAAALGTPINTAIDAVMPPVNGAGQQRSGRRDSGCFMPYLAACYWAAFQRRWPARSWRPRWWSWYCTADGARQASRFSCLPSRSRAGS